MMRVHEIIQQALATANEVMGEEVNYGRGDLMVKLKASAGNSQFQIDDGNGVVLEIDSVDWFIMSDDLVLNGNKTEPVRGDTITRTLCGQKYIYETMSPTTVDQPFKYSDVFRKRLRVHTKLRSVVPL